MDAQGKKKKKQLIDWINELVSEWMENTKLEICNWPGEVFDIWKWKMFLV